MYTRFLRRYYVKHAIGASLECVEWFGSTKAKKIEMSLKICPGV